VGHVPEDGERGVRRCWEEVWVAELGVEGERDRAHCGDETNLKRVEVAE